jgi:hypothetical protein
MDWVSVIQLVGIGITVGLAFGNWLDNAEPTGTSSEEIRGRLRYLGWWELVRLGNAIDDEFAERSAEKERFRQLNQAE